jgi:hypothetical protein
MSQDINPTERSDSPKILQFLLTLDAKYILKTDQ